MFNSFKAITPVVRDFLIDTEPTKSIWMHMNAADKAAYSDEKIKCLDEAGLKVFMVRKLCQVMKNEHYKYNTHKLITMICH